MQPSTSSATSATTMEVSTFQTLEDAKPQANRKWRISFSKIKILQEATSFDLYADGLFGNEMHSKIQHAVLFDLCNDSLQSLFSTSSKVMVFGNQTHRPSESWLERWAHPTSTANRTMWSIASNESAAERRVAASISDLLSLSWGWWGIDEDGG